MSDDVSVKVGVQGTEETTGAFREIGAVAKEMGDALKEHTMRLAETYLGYESLVKVMETFKQAFELTGKLSELSDQTGISSDRLAVLSRMFQNSGLDADDLGKYINKLQKFIEGAGDAGSANAKKLAELGLTFDDIKNLSPEEQFATVAKALAGIQDPTEKAALAMEIFGRSGGKTLTLFNDWDDASEKATLQVGGLAEVLKTNAKTFEEIDDNFKALGEKAVEFSVGILEKALPALKTLTDYLSNMDATEFGKQFGQTLADAVDFALGIFKDPGDTFLAFGDAFVVAFKSGLNVLRDGLQYVFDWTTNYFEELIPSYADIFKSEFDIAVGSVVGFFANQLAKVFSDLAVLIPGKLGDAMGQAAQKLAGYSKDAVDLAQQGLANAWEKIGNVVAKATEETHLQSQDWMDVASSAQQMREHTDAVRENGAAFRDQMQEANEFAKDMPKYVDAMVGGAKTFKEYMDQANSDQQGIFAKQKSNSFSNTNDQYNQDVIKKLLAGNTATQSVNLPDTSGGVNSSGPAAPPIYQDQQLSGGIFNVKDLASGFQIDLNASSAEIQNRSGNLYDAQIKRAQASGSYGIAAYLQQQKIDFINSQASDALQAAAERQAASDYTGEDGSNTSDALTQIQSKYENQGFNIQSSKEMAQKEFTDYVNKIKGPSGDKTNSDGLNGQQKSPQEQTNDTIKQILEYLRDRVRLDEKLPLMALS